ncbi:MAG: O-antigen ligase family protein [Patescibacteria group bacterium]|nr:O-antigen ligase family protein [Patescibacteria group bacterium]
MKLVQSFAVITIVSLPLYVIRWQIGGIPTTLLEILILSTFFSWAIWLTFTKRAKDIFKFFKCPFFWPAALFLLAGLISVWVSPDKKGALGIYKAYFIEPVLFALVVGDLIQRLDSFTWAIKFLVISGLWLSLLSIWQLISSSNPLAPYEIGQGRVSAVYNSANALGLYLGPIVALTTGLLLNSSTWRSGKTLLKFLTLVLFLIVFYFTHSRGSWFGLVGIASIYLLWWFYQKLSSNAKKWFVWGIKGLAAVFIIGSVYFFLNISSYAPNYKFSYPRKTDDTLTIRLCVWEGTKDLLVQYPIFGVGLDGFHSIYPKYRTCDNEPLMYPHNIFLNFWMETGILGLLAFLWLVLVYFKKIFIALSKNKENQILSLSLLSAMVYLFIQGLVDVPYFKNDLSVEFWLLLTLTVLMRG